MIDRVDSMDFSESRCPEMEEMAEMGFREWKWAMRGVELCHTEPLARRRQSTETTESFNSHTDCTDHTDLPCGVI